jgi:outer membrane protein assembly factor BamB
MSPKPRLWPAALIVLGGAIWIATVWLLGDAIRQARILRTMAAVALTVLLLMCWLVFFSRLPRRARLAGAATAAAALALVPALFRVRGVTGDLVPILEPRWAGHEPPPLPVPPVEAPVVTATPTPEALPTPSPEAPAARPHPGPAAARPLGLHDYPQFLGPRRDATLPGPRLARDWGARPPRLVWRRSVGAAWSAFAVAGELAVTQEQRGGEERVVAYELATGRPRWSHADPARYETVIAGVGPRATPTIDGGRVFTMGATGILNALDLGTGRRLWRRQAVEENGATAPEWGKSCSPLVAGGHVIVSAGGRDGRSLVAYDAASGELAWSGGDDRASYSSPALLSLAGRPQVVILNRASVAGHDPETGALLWEHPFPREQPNVAQPLLLPGDRLLVSAGYGVGSRLFQVAPGEDAPYAARLVWESLRLKSKFANLVFHDGLVYGLDDGVLTCLDPATGERRWKGGRYGHGQLLLVGGLLLVQTEEGEAVLVEPDPEAHRELTRFRLLEGKTWNPPALAGSQLLVRNDREAAAYDLPLAP